MFINSLPNDVTWFSSSQVGAPQMMGGSNGDLLKVLDACLVNGFGSKSVVSVTVDGDAVTLGFGVGHGYLQRQRVLVSGANDPLLNGNHRIISMTNNTVTLNIAGVSDTTGAVTAKIAPLGFESMFGDSDALRRAYRSTSSTSSKRVLFLDMTYPAGAGYHATAPAKRATVSVCEDMDTLGEQIGSFTDTANNFATAPNGSLFWYQKRAAAKTAAVPNTPSPWKIIGNGNYFYLLVGWSSNLSYDSAVNHDVFGFGEFAGIGDPSGDNQFLITATNSNDNVNTGTPVFGANFANTTSGLINDPSVYRMTDTGFKRDYLSVISSTTTTLALRSGDGILPYPNGSSSSLFTQPLRVGGRNNTITGVMPSMMFVENNVASGGLSHDQTLVDDVLLAHVHYQPVSTAERYAYYAFYLGD